MEPNLISSLVHHLAEIQTNDERIVRKNRSFIYVEITNRLNKKKIK